MFSIVNLPAFLLLLAQHLSSGQQLVSFQSKEYFIEKNNPVRSYLEAEENCRTKSAEMAIVNSKKIQEFLGQKINVTELQSKCKFPYCYNCYIYDLCTALTSYL